MLGCLNKINTFSTTSRKNDSSLFCSKTLKFIRFLKNIKSVKKQIKSENKKLKLNLHPNEKYKMYKVFEIKTDIELNLCKNKSDFLGYANIAYISNFRDTGEPCFMLHGSENGFRIKNNDTYFDAKGFLDYIKEKYPNLMQKIETDKKPLHVVACQSHASMAQDMANQLKRPVLIYGSRNNSRLLVSKNPRNFFDKIKGEVKNSGFNNAIIRKFYPNAEKIDSEINGESTWL